MASKGEAGSTRVLICAPYGRDGPLIQSALASAGLQTNVCAKVEHLCEEISNGAGAALLSDEALSPTAIHCLDGVLHSQPSWSDFPLLVMTAGGESTHESRERLKKLEPLGNVTLLERPLRVATLNSGLRSALRARRRQYEIRDQLAAEERASALLRESESQFRQMADSMPQLVWVTRPDGYHEYYNRRWYEYTGLDYETTRGDGWNHVFHPEDRPRAWELWRYSLATGEPYEIEYRCRRADGQYRWFLGRATALRDAEGNIVRWFGTCTDIHDQKVLLESLREANAELEEFAYIASHDLQEPLRMVNSFTQLLLERHEDPESPEPAEFARYIRNGVKRMELLIEDLLAYSRTIHAEKDLDADANLCLVLQESISLLQPMIESTGARIRCQGLPTVHCDPAQLTHVVQNLLHNALKYRDENAPPDIDITAKSEGTDWVISIRDNGIGFEPQYAEKIFGLFKRLHRDEYPGTGLGLAICKRIVERHGGRIWAESQPGKGSVFHFSLRGVEPSETSSDSSR